MPTTIWTHAAVMQELPAIIADCLGVEEAEVLPQSNFRHDLGGESIDDIDLSFRCDRAFGCKGMFQPLLTLPVDGEGFLEPAAFQQFQSRVPALADAVANCSQSRFRPGDLIQFYTTELIAHFVLAAIPDGNRIADRSVTPIGL
jgi:acyl carrier protein